MANGDLIAVYMEATDHATTQDGRIRKRTSSTSGASWSAATTIVPSGTDDVRGASVVVLSTGRVVVTYWTWDGTDNDGARIPWRIYSDDNGSTWSSAAQIGNSFTYWAITQSPPIELANGDLLVALYGLDDGDSNTRRSCRISRSTNQGVSFTHDSEICDGPADGKNYGEPNLALLDDGDVLAMIRCDTTVGSQGEIHSSRSTDGTTWPKPRSRFNGCGSPAVIQRDDGLIVCQVRRNANGDHRFHASYDGETWDQSDGDFTGGSTLESEYGAWVELATGQIAAVYSLETSSTDADLFFAKLT